MPRRPPKTAFLKAGFAAGGQALRLESSSHLSGLGDPIVLLLLPSEDSLHLTTVAQILTVESVRGLGPIVGRDSSAILALRTFQPPMSALKPALPSSPACTGAAHYGAVPQ